MRRINFVYKEDLENISANPIIDWKKFNNKNILITGATGLIGHTVIDAIVYSCKKHNVKVQVLALVRSIENAHQLFSDFENYYDNITFIAGDVRTLPNIAQPVDFILHGASVTASEEFVIHPVETVKTAINGTINILELALEKKVKSMVYLSTTEIYGFSKNDAMITEQIYFPLDPLSIRNCYPESKRMAENICMSYAQEYQLNINIARLTQTFGPGISDVDKRVFAYFARCARNCEDIVLQTEGTSRRMYLYTMDAASALLTIMLSNTAKEAYNVANEETYCSIKEMAHTAIEALMPGCGLKVVIDPKDLKSLSHFTPPHYSRVDTSKMRNLGWKPLVGLSEMFMRMESCSQNSLRKIGS